MSSVKCQLAVWHRWIETKMELRIPLSQIPREDALGTRYFVYHTVIHTVVKVRYDTPMV